VLDWFKHKAHSTCYLKNKKKSVISGIFSQEQTKYIEVNNDINESKTQGQEGNRDGGVWDSGENRGCRNFLFFFKKNLYGLNFYCSKKIDIINKSIESPMG
jgi:hypothetical protein